MNGTDYLQNARKHGTQLLNVYRNTKIKKFD